MGRKWVKIETKFEMYAMNRDSQLHPFGDKIFYSSLKVPFDLYWRKN
jgi:hypothetical protein